MNDLTAQDQLLAQLPERLRASLLYVYPRVYYRDVEVVFMNADGPTHITIPRHHWLDAWALAKICLEAP